MLGNRLAKNAKNQARWAARENVSCYRLYDHDIPEIPLVVDWYECLSASPGGSPSGRLHIAEYARGSSPQGEAHGLWIEALVAAAAAALGVDESATYCKRRVRQRALGQYERFAQAGVVETVMEGGRRFKVNLSDYLDTGLFLDHRTTRRWIGDCAKGQRVLNLFAYTGSFSVYAATGGAARTVTVDWSNTYLDWARDNFELNKIKGDHHFIRDDALGFLEHDKGQHDIIVVDPPTHSKRTDKSPFDIQRDHPHLLSLCRARLAPGGRIMFSTNFRGFRPGAVLADFKEVSDRTVPTDFRDRKIHRAFWLGPR